MNSFNSVKEALEKSWCLETAYPGDREYWTPEKSSIGQCTVTSMVLFDYFGGRIIRGYSKKYNIYHYWNIIDGVKIDLTFSQFIPDKADIKFDKVVEKNKNDLLKIKNVRVRYQLLKTKVSDVLIQDGSSSAH